MPRMRFSALGITAGMNSDFPANQLDPRAAPNLSNVQVRRGFMRPRFGLATFANRPNNDPVIKLAAARYENGGADLFRIKNRSTGTLGEIRLLNGTTWDAIASDAGLAVANGVLLGNDLNPWDSATVLSKPIFVNGVNENVYYDPGVNLKPLGGNKSRYVIQYQNRTFLAYQDAGAGFVANQIQSSAPGTFNTFTGVGSVQTQLRDDPFPITGLSVNRRFTVYKERSIIVGTPVGQASQPVRYETINTAGVGLWAPGTLAKLGSFDAFLGSDDFYTFDATGAPQPLASPIRELLLGGINYDRLAQTHALHDPENGEVVWFIPMGEDRFAKDAWVWNYRLNAWWHWQFSAEMGASAAFPSVVGLTYDSAGAMGLTYDTASFSYDDMSAVSSKLSMIVGEAGEDVGASTTYGRTLRFDPATHADAFNVPANVAWFYDLPAIDLESVSFDENRQPIRALRAKDWKTLDQVDIIYKDLGGAVPSVVCEVSVDEGNSYTTFDTQTLSVVGGGVRTKSFFGRVAGQRLQVRISGVATDFAIRDIVLYITTSGGGR